MTENHFCPPDRGETLIKSMPKSRGRADPYGRTSGSRINCWICGNLMRKLRAYPAKPWPCSRRSGTTYRTPSRCWVARRTMRWTWPIAPLISRPCADKSGTDWNHSPMMSSGNTLGLWGAHHRVLEPG